MKILAGRVNWRDRYANRPELELLVDNIPRDENMVFHEREGLHYAELDGYVRFMLNDPSNQRGYGGRTFKIKMDDGSVRNLVGPWSSRPSVANKLGFGPCIDAAMTDKKADWDLGRIYISGNCTVELVRSAKDVIRFGDGINYYEGYYKFPYNSTFTLARYNLWDDEVHYEPALIFPDGNLYLKEGEFKSEPKDAFAD